MRAPLTLQPSDATASLNAGGKVDFEDFLFAKDFVLTKSILYTKVVLFKIRWVELMARATFELLSS